VHLFWWLKTRAVGPLLQVLENPFMARAAVCGFGSFGFWGSLISLSICALHHAGDYPSNIRCDEYLIDFIKVFYNSDLELAFCGT
jgi:hypothetical protein